MGCGGFVLSFWGAGFAAVIRFLVIATLVRIMICENWVSF